MFSQFKVSVYLMKLKLGKTKISPAINHLPSSCVTAVVLHNASVTKVNTHIITSLNGFPQLHCFHLTSQQVKKYLS